MRWNFLQLVGSQQFHWVWTCSRVGPRWNIEEYTTNRCRETSWQKLSLILCPCFPSKSCEHSSLAFCSRKATETTSFLQYRNEWDVEIIPVENQWHTEKTWWHCGSLSLQSIPKNHVLENKALGLTCLIVVGEVCNYSLRHTMAFNAPSLCPKVISLARGSEMMVSFEMTAMIKITALFEHNLTLPRLELDGFFELGLKSETDFSSIMIPLDVNPTTQTLDLEGSSSAAQLLNTFGTKSHKSLRMISFSQSLYANELL